MEIYFVLFLLLLFSAYFSALETAFSSVNRVRLKHAENNGDRRAKLALKIADRFDKALSTILIGNNIVNIASTALATALVVKYFPEHGTLISTILMTVIVLTFGEILPKGFAKENSEAICLLFARSLRFFMILFTPFVTIFVWVRKAVSFIFNVKSSGKPTVSFGELRYFIKMLSEHGGNKHQVLDIMDNALSFSDIAVREVLTPRINMITVDVNASTKNTTERILTTGISRFPVYEKNIDSIVGILHSRDWFGELLHEKKPKIYELVKPCLYIHSTMKISALLTLFKRKRQHMAIVTDDFGGTLGLVTLEDVLEELVGEIWDEVDEVRNNIVPREDGMIMFSGDTSMRDFLAAFKIQPTEFTENTFTVGGFAMYCFGRLPEEKDEITYKGIYLKILQREDTRIVKVLAGIVKVKDK